MESKSNGSRTGLGAASVLFLIFLTLKLTGLIAWSWWWICSPLWIAVLLYIVLVAIVFIVSWIQH